MRNVLMGLTLLAGGCVFQESPEIPANDNNATNGSNNATNGSNNATNNTTNNTPECTPQPDFCEGYFQCGEGFIDPATGPTCHYDCGTCSGDSRCIPSSEICSTGTDISHYPSGHFVVEFADTRSGMAVLWSDNTYGVLNPDGTVRPLDFGLSAGTEITAIAASATRWVAVGQPSMAKVVVGENGAGKSYPLDGPVGSGFGRDIALAQVEELVNQPSFDRAIGVVGAPDAKDAFIISKAAALDWKIGESLAGKASVSELGSFGEHVAISPSGKTVLVDSSRGIEVFVAGQVMTAWSFDQTVTASQPDFGKEFVVGDSYAVVASERMLNFYTIRPDNSVDASSKKTVSVTTTGRIVDVDMISAGNGRTVVFALVRNALGDLVLQMWQPGAVDWIRTNTIVPIDLGFGQFVVVAAGVFDGPNPPSSSFPVVVMSGTEGNLLRVRLVPLFPATDP